MSHLMTRIAGLPPARRQLLDTLLQQHRAVPANATPYAAPRTEIERTLAAIWAAVLGVDRVGLDDNFFELGGDSIHSIQIIAKARQAGIRLTNTQLFDHPTIARLSAVASPVCETRALTPAADGDVPLTPIQRWFFEQPIQNRNHWNQAVLLSTPWTVADESAVRAAWRAVVARHETLRLRFEQHQSSWRQSVADVREGDAEIAIVDLTLASVEGARTLVDAVVTQAQRSLDLPNGPITRLILFRRPAAAPHLALVLAHHLVIDAVSCRTLVEDLSLACKAARRGETITLPTPSASFPALAQRLAELAASDTLRAELPYWQRQLQDSRLLSADNSRGHNLERDARTCTIALNETDTSALRRARPGGGASAQHVLLAALYRTLTSATQQRRICVWIEGHGRHDDEVDLSRTVGWLTTMFPVALESEHPDAFDRLLVDTRRTLDAVPSKGQGYGLLRYLHPDAEVRAALAGRGGDVLFNYLGVFDDLEARASGFAIEDAAPRGQYDPHSERPFALQVYGGIYGSRLVMHWTYSRSRHRPETIEAWAHAFRDHVRALATRPPADEELANAVVGDVALTRADIAAIVAAHERG